MNPTDYAHKLITDTAHLRPTTDGTVRYVKAENPDLGTFTLELSRDRVYLSYGDTPSVEANDFLWSVMLALEGMRELSSLAQEVAA